MPLTHLECAKCGRRYEAGQVLNLCECGKPLFARYNLERAAKNMRPGHLALREPTLWRYDDVTR
jgi:threonine synthase